MPPVKTANHRVFSGFILYCIVLYCIVFAYAIEFTKSVRYAISSKYVGSPEKDWFL